MIKDLIQSASSKSYSYDDYMKLMEEFSKSGKTTGAEKSESLIYYTDLNYRRMKRLNKTFQVTEDLKQTAQNLNEDISILAITESWCGDAAQNLVVFGWLDANIKSISLKLVLRDENPELMDQFLTNGSRSIPKMIIYRNSDYEILGSWGPRPEHAQMMRMAFKENPQGSYEDFNKELQLWYAKDKTLSLQAEVNQLLKDCLA